MTIQPHKKKNKISHITTTVTGLELSNEEEFGKDSEVEDKYGCPFIMVKIDNHEYEMLIDSGADVSVVSIPYEETIRKINKTIPMLPITGVSIYNAMGTKPVKINKQILLPITLDKEKIQVPFIVVPQLNEGGIIGSDMLEKYNAKIDYKRRTLSLWIDINKIQIPFTERKGNVPTKLKTVQTQINTSSEHPIKINKLPNRVQKYLDRILDDYEEVFRDEPGKITGYECTLRLKNNTPVRVKPYPIPIAKQAAVEAEIKRMIKMGIIEKSNSPYSIPIVPVFKKNGEVRLCLDARKINELIIPDCERPISMETMFTKFNNVKCISTLDLRSGYWQIPLSSESKEPCSFLINGRNYSYRRLPFGLNVSGAEFQKGMDMVLGPLVHKFVTIYIDDILITSENTEQHYQHIREVLERFKKFNVTVNLAKCQFFQQEVSFLGHIITTEGIRMDEEKIKTIQRFKTPSTKKDLQSYLGFLNFYRRYIDKFAHNIEPMVELLRKNCPWTWETKHQNAFEKSKQDFLKEVIIAFPDFSKPLYINTDASNSAIGGELFQIIDDNRATLGFASRILKPAETRYTTTELEALALVYCCSKFRQYLIGHKIIIQTDHMALTFIKQCQLSNGRLTRWALALQEYDFEIVHIPGKMNIAADTLTRYPREGETRIEQRISINKIKTPSYSRTLNEKLLNMSEEQAKDKHIHRLLHKQTACVTTKNNIVFSRKGETDKWQIMIPKHIANMIATETHEIMGHPGRYKTYHAIREEYSFANMHRIVAETVKNCDTCQRNKPINYAPGGRITTHKPKKILEKVSIDLMGPLPTGRGGTHFILAILDTFSKYIKLYALKRATTKAIIKRLVQDYIPEMGTPETILSDNGTQFTSRTWNETMAKLDIKCAFSTKYHPQSNPVERYNREIGRLLRTYCNDQHTKWPLYLCLIESWLNRLKSEVTEKTPTQIIKGKLSQTEARKIIQFPDQPSEEVTTDEICTIAKRIKDKAEKREMKTNRNKRHNTYKEGQLILIKNHRISSTENKEIKKLFNLFEGPFRIKKLIGETTLVITGLNDNEEELINVTEARPYHRATGSE